MKKVIFILLTTLLLFSCASLKPLKKDEVFQSNLSLKISTEELDGVQIRIKKGEKIWLDYKYLGATIARILIDKDSIRAYENISKSYLSSSWKDLNAPKKLNYKNLEQLFLGRKNIKYKDFQITSVLNPDGFPKEITFKNGDTLTLLLIYKNPQKIKNLELPFSPPKKRREINNNDIQSFKKMLPI